MFCTFTLYYMFFCVIVNYCNLTISIWKLCCQSFTIFLSVEREECCWGVEGCGVLQTNMERAEKNKKAINVMRCFARFECKQVILHICLLYTHVVLIQARIDGCVMYGSEAKTVLSDLDVIQAHALRFCFEAVETASVGQGKCHCVSVGNI